MTRHLQSCTWSGLLIATTVAVGLTMMARGDSPPGKVGHRKAPDKRSLTTGDFKGGDVDEGGVAGGVCYAGGCTDATVLYPSELFSTTSPEWTTFTACAYAGEHSRFSVVAGHTYEWTSCSADGADCPWDSQFMLRDIDGNNLCYNDDFCGLQSKIEWTATFTGEVHLARMEFYCATNTDCALLRWRQVSGGACGGPGAGDCCIANGTPGCDDATCCNAVCANDPFCCDVDWDTACANGAAADPVNCPQCQPAPPNDNCQDVVIDTLACGGTLTWTGDNTGATGDCGSLVDPEVWHAFTINETMDVTVAYCGTTPAFASAYIVMDQSCPCSGAFVFADNWEDTSCGDGNWTLYWPDLPAGNYYYPVLSEPGSMGPYTITVTGTCAGGCGDPGAGDCCVANGTPGCDDATCCNAICAIDPYCCEVAWDTACANEAAADPVNCPQCVGGPPNDECAGALPISNGNTAYDMTGATFDTTDCFSPGFPSIYYDYTADFTGDLTINACDDLDYNGIEVYDGCGCPTNVGDQLACDGGITVCSPKGHSSEVTIPVVNGSCYKIRLTTTLESTGTITITKPLADGACCIAMDCLILPEPECLAQGGVYQGDGTTCGGGPPLVYDSFPNAPLPDGDPVGVSDTITVPDSFAITDLNVALHVTHTYVGDLCVTLVHQPTGTTVNLIMRMGASGGCHLGSPYGCSEDNMNIVLDDQGTGGPIENQCIAGLSSPPNYVPNDPLAAFNGLDSAGAWTLNVSDNAGADLGTFVSWALRFPGGGKNPCAGPGQVNFFFNQGPFDEAVAAAGKLLKGVEDFEEANVPDGSCSGIDDPLDANTDNGIFFPGDILCNLAFQSNLDSPGVNGPNPRGPLGLAACGPGAGQGSADKGVTANFFADSTDILSLNPNHTAMALRIADIGNSPGPIEVRVFDKNEALLGGVTVDTTLPGTFIGFIMKDQQTFGRVNLSSTGSVGTENIYVVRAYVSPNLSPCPWDLNGDNTVGILDLLALLAAWGPNPGDPANFDGDCSVGILDLLALLANWGPCPLQCGDPGSGDCCVANGTAGCNDAVCCNAICAIDPFCCDAYWDQICASEAAADPFNCPQCTPAGCAGPFECGGTFIECGPGDPCFCFHGAAGDAFCGDTTVTTCSALVPCPGGEGDCPPGFRCAVLTCCTTPVCLPECAAAASATPEVRPVLPGTLTITGVAKENPLTTGKN